MKVQFGGTYQITGVKNANGSDVSEEQKTQALKRFFLQHKGDWRGMSGSSDGGWLSTVRDGNLYVANNDENGRQGATLSTTVNGLNHTSRFINTAWRTVGVHHLAKAYLAAKGALWSNPLTSKALNKAFKDPQPAELVITTEPANLLDEKITNTVIRPV